MAESKKQIENPQWQTDVLVYAAIRYLDSLTDYRECLPHVSQSKMVQNQKRPKKSAVENNDFILLDDSPVYRLNWLWSFALIAAFLCVVLLGLLRS
jgi:hypothetical protein